MSACGGRTIHRKVPGVGIGVEAETAVTGNVIENAPYAGIRLGFGPYLRNVTAVGNVIRDAGIGIAVSVVQGAGAAAITGNIIQAPNAAPSSAWNGTSP